MNLASPDSTVASTATSTLRLLWPQWQGASPHVVAALIPEMPLAQAQRGYAVGTTVLEAVLPPHTGPTAHVPVTLGADGLDSKDGVDAKDVLVSQLGAALDLIAEHAPERILTLGGECSVSVAPFSALAARNGDDLASCGSTPIPTSARRRVSITAITRWRWRTCAATVTPTCSPRCRRPCPVPASPSRACTRGPTTTSPTLRSGVLPTFSPEDLRTSSAALLDWLAATGCHHVAIHLDVDVVDSDEIVLGLGAEPGGLTSAQVHRLVTDIAHTADVVGFTIAEYVPRQVMVMQRFTTGMPLL